jgi:hypothetical protein
MPKTCRVEVLSVRSCQAQSLCVLCWCAAVCGTFSEQGDDLLSPAMCAARPAEGGAPPEALKRAAASRGANTYDKFTDYTRLIKQGLVSLGVCGVP